MAARKVIVFGPTGAVGSAVARTAEELGATVVLAMRDTSKSIPSISEEKIKSGNFEKVTADLMKADTVSEAVKSSGAKYAFFYLAHGSPDNMRATIEALKSSGIEKVVFLSSFTIRGDLDKIEQHDIIPYIHARVEMNLEEIYGRDNFVAARPGSFASNTLAQKSDIQKGEVKLFGPDVTIDNIVPDDIGRVCGTVLAKGPQDEERKIYLYGPELMTWTDSVKVLAKVMGKNPTIGKASEEDAYKQFIEEQKVPKIFATYMIEHMKKATPGESQVHGYPVTKEELSNVEKYSGKRATTFEEWAEKNREMLTS